MSYLAFVVCYQLHKKTAEQIFMKILLEMCFLTRSVLLNLTSHLVLDLDIFKDSSTLHNRTFSHNLAHIPGKTDQIFMKIMPQMYVWTKKYTLNFESHLYQPWWRSALSECFCFML